jgi:hypothetical protein
MICTKLPNGYLLISDIINGEYVKQLYTGYTKKEAQRRFRIYTNQIKKNWFEYLAQ